MEQIQENKENIIEFRISQNLSDRRTEPNIGNTKNSKEFSISSNLSDRRNIFLQRRRAIYRKYWKRWGNHYSLKFRQVEGPFSFTDEVRNLGNTYFIYVFLKICQIEGKLFLCDDWKNIVNTKNSNEFSISRTLSDRRTIFLQRRRVIYREYEKEWGNHYSLKFYRWHLNLVFLSQFFWVFGLFEYHFKEETFALEKGLIICSGTELNLQLFVKIYSSSGKKIAREKRFE